MPLRPRTTAHGLKPHREVAEGPLPALATVGLEDHVWFEDRWMVASWCDE
jgi:hypothetical protein